MDLFLFISVIVGMTFLFLCFVMNFELKKKKVELEEQRLMVEKSKLERSIALIDEQDDQDNK
ncbi:hypothetical protein N781_02710 [Pontibacillus halophilus JSM 076056 = DSM 19796]|uniref:Uncharacterized protein n=1 Tax=Pontibacillus halophilus JSM 076056 = DSM 19796 TaxID=1385510 RepID=A0A0A5GLH5_9BACI|nr:hypothetical protein [Pontibacillus halophilus]KGX92063.1 hypothetical protein N781_02710 [Pontibacillus halophilus JSM 076056 = DSM 19796]